jgi:arylsulfatase A-like enzyme
MRKHIITHCGSEFQMKQNRFYQIFICIIISVLFSNCASMQKSQVVERTDPRPNIIVIMSDDMGYSDIGCYGSEIHTPNLDSLANNGLRFTQFYNTARCCPTRASILTGLYPHQAGIGHMMSNRNLRGYQGDLSKNAVTIAEVLGTAGYSTYMAGKWHVTPKVKPGSSKHNWPRQRGFDKFFGTIHGAGSFYDPNSLTEDNTLIVPDENFYYTNAISNRTVKYINEHQTDNPFFIYVTYTAAHWPMHALPQDIAKYKGRYDEGWDVLRKERYDRMVRMGLIDPRWAMSPRDKGVPAWEDEEMKEWQTSRMEVYAAMIDNMDQGIGRIVQALKDQGQLDNTLILFLQDNGGCAEEYGSRGKITPDPSLPVVLEPMGPDELQLDMRPKVTRDGRPVRVGKGVIPGPPDTYIAYGKGWANASNTPFRMFKHWVHEGGISTPLIAHWPKTIKDHGEFRDKPGHLIDIMATCVEVAQAKYPMNFNGNTIVPMQGESLVPAFQNILTEQRPIFWEHEGCRAVRLGNWKLVSKPKRLMNLVEEDYDAWELYNLKEDRSELNNLAKIHPDKAEELKTLWYEWAEKAYVLPWPWDAKE